MSRRANDSSGFKSAVGPGPSRAGVRDFQGENIANLHKVASVVAERLACESVPAPAPWKLPQFTSVGSKVTEYMRRPESSSASAAPAAAPRASAAEARPIPAPFVRVETVPRKSAVPKAVELASASAEAAAASEESARKNYIRENALAAMRAGGGSSRGGASSSSFGAERHLDGAGAGVGSGAASTSASPSSAASSAAASPSSPASHGGGGAGGRGPASSATGRRHGSGLALLHSGGGYAPTGGGGGGSVARPSTSASSPSSSDPASIFKHADYGALPAYLLSRRDEWAREAREKEAAAEAADVPPGMRLMPAEERVETLALLRARIAETVEELSKFKLHLVVPSHQRRKADLESRLAKMEEATKVFSKDKVFVKL